MKTDIFDDNDTFDLNKMIRESKEKFDNLKAEIIANNFDNVKDLIDSGAPIENVHEYILDSILSSDTINIDILNLVINKMLSDFEFLDSNRLRIERINRILKNKKITEELIKRNQKFRDYFGLFYAIEKEDVKLASSLIESKADMGFSLHKTFIYKTPLFEAIKSKNIDIINTLIDHNADVNEVYVQDDDRYYESQIRETPLLEALQSGNKEIVKLLIERKADVKFFLLKKQVFNI